MIVQLGMVLHGVARHQSGVILLEVAHRVGVILREVINQILTMVLVAQNQDWKVFAPSVS